MTDFPLTAAGGNSRAARSARAKLQWRDRYGRWIEMGRGIKFKVRLPNGATPSVNGQFVGAKSSDIGQVYVKNDPNGVPDGFYDVTSANAQEFIASLSPEALAERGIELGKDVSGNPVGSRIDSDIPNLADMPREEAPEGWTVTKRDANGNPTSFSTDDGDYGYDLATWGYPMMWKKDNTTYTKVNDWAEGLSLVNKIDEGSASWDDVSDKPKKASREELEAKLAKLNDQFAKTQNAAALNRIERQIAEVEAELEAEDAAPEGDAPEASSGIDTDTHGVAKEGFIVPTGKKSENSSPESIAQLVERERDYLTEGSGKRLVVDSEAGTAEIYTSADTLDNAKAQAGGMGAGQVIDLSSGEEIAIAGDEPPVDPNSPEVNPNLDGDNTPREERTNDQDSNSDSEQPVGDDSGPDSPVGDSGDADRADSGGATDANRADSGDSARNVEPPRPLTLEEKQAKLDKLYERHAKAKNPDVLDTLDREIASLEADIERDSSLDGERDRARQEVSDAQAELDAARQAESDAGEDAGADVQERVDIAKQDVEGLQARLDSLEENMDKSIEELKTMLSPVPAGVDASELSPGDRVQNPDGSSKRVVSVERSEDVVTPSRKAPGSPTTIPGTVETPYTVKFDDGTSIEGKVTKELDSGTPLEGENLVNVVQTQEQSDSEESGSWAADRQNPTIEELNNAPEGSLIKRTNRESMDETFFIKEGPLWRSISRKGVPGKFTTRGDTFARNGSNVTDVIDELPDAPKPVEVETPEGLSDEQIQGIVDSTIANEGGSFNLVDGTSPEDGYMVATRGHNREIPLDDFTDPIKGPEAIRQYILDKADVLSQPGMHLGTWFDKKNNEVALDVSEKVDSREEAIAAGIERNQQAIWDNEAGEEIPTGGTGDRAETVTLDPSGDLTAQIQNAIDSGANIRFQYTSTTSGTKVRTVTPKRVWFNPRQGHNLLESTDLETGETRNFILEKIEPVGGSVSPSEMSTEDIDAELASYDFESADTETRRRIFDLEMERAWRNDAPIEAELPVADLQEMPEADLRSRRDDLAEDLNMSRQADPEEGEQEIQAREELQAINEELDRRMGVSRMTPIERAEERARRSSAAFSGIADSGAPLDLTPEGEPTNSSAIFEIPNPETYPARSDLPGIAGDEFPATTTSESLTDEEIPDVLTPEEISQTPVGDMAPQQYDFPYQDSDEDYADEPFMPTDEQRSVIRSVLSRFNTVVQALAGSGKTSTLVLIAKQMAKKFPDRQGIYLVFNKKNQIEGEARMPKNFKVLTMDALAYRGVSKGIQQKLGRKDAIRRPEDVARIFGIEPQKVQNADGEFVNIGRNDVARQLVQALNNWTITSDDDFSPRNFDGLDIEYTPENVATLTAMWQDLRSEDGQLNMSHQHIMKMWALTRPDLSSVLEGPRRDVVFVDEAQDLNPVFSKIIRDQTIQKVVVGDSRQAIYGFRGAADEMDTIQADATLPLTQSWRFGPQIAGMGNRFLSLLNSPLKIVGGGKDGEILSPGEMENPDAILTRSNSGALGAIMQELEKGRTVGADKNFKNEMLSFVDSVRSLKTGQGVVTHEDFAEYRDWDELEEAVNKGTANVRAQMLYDLVDRFGVEEIARAVGSIVVPGGEDGEANVGEVSYTPGASGFLMSKKVFVETRNGKRFPATPSLDYSIDGEPGDLTLHVFPSEGDKNKFATLNLKNDLVGAGLRAKKKSDGSWEYVFSGDEEQLKEVVSRLGGNVSVDVVVSTAHKSKGLEWGRVKIGDDFKGPKVDPETGETEFPTPEEIRLAYVAVTRAQQVLDPGSLAWVLDYTSEEDERADVPSRGLPGEEPEVSEAPAPTPEPEVAPEVTPEPEVAPEVTPEPEVAPEVTPEPEPEPTAPEAVEETPPASEVSAEPTLESPEDDLPDSVEELEEIAGRMEREIATARGPRARVLQREIDKIYDKIERLEEQNNAPDTEEPDVPAVEEEVLPDPTEVAPAESIVRAFIEGKDVDESQTEIIEDLIERGDIEAVQEIVSATPNKPNTETKPKPAPEHRAPVNEERARAPRSVSYVEEPNEILGSLKADFPDHEIRDNNDTVIARKVVGNREYAIVVRRTNREQFFAFLEETDRTTGMRRVLRLRKEGKRNHSYRALMTQINTGFDLIRKDPKKMLDRKRKGVEVLSPGEDLREEVLDKIITGTDLPMAKDDVYNNVVKAIADLADDPDISVEVLRTLATDNGFNPDLVDGVLAAVARRKYAESLQRPGFGAPSHISYNAQVVEEGAIVDWTDTDRTVPVKDEFGNIVYGPDGKALNRPNPNYGRVFRGRVTKVLPRKETNYNRYTYSDPVLVNFPEYDEVMGTRSLQRDRTSAGLVVVPDEGAPMSAPFFPPGRQEAAAKLRASDFGAPEGAGPTVARELQPVYWESLDGETTEDGLWEVPFRDAEIRLPVNHVEYASILNGSIAMTKKAGSISPGVFIALDREGLNVPALVVEREFMADGTVRLTLVRPTGNGGYVKKTIALPEIDEQRFVVFDPASTALRADMSDNASVSEIQDKLKTLMASKVVPARLRPSLEKALSSEDATVESLADVADSLRALKNKKPTKKDANALADVLAQIRDNALKDPYLGQLPNVVDLSDAIRMVRQDFANLDAVPEEPVDVRPPRFSNDFTDIEIPDQEDLDREDRAREALKRSFEKGFTVDVTRPIEAGIINNGAALGVTADGRKVFTKLVADERDYQNEILAMRVANVLGLRRIRTAGLGKVANPEGIEIREGYRGDTSDGMYYQIVMDEAPGKMAAQVRNYQDLIREMDTNVEVALMGIFDYITDFSDRNPGNFFITPEKDAVVPIDNSGAFSRYGGTEFTAQLEKLLTSGTVPLTSAQLLRLRGQLFGLQDEFAEMGRHDSWVDLMINMNKILNRLNGYYV